MFINELIARSKIKFQEDVEYLSTLFADIEHIEGTIVELQGKTGCHNYTKHIGFENTLVVCNKKSETTVLFFKHGLQEHIELELFESVTVTDHFVFTRGCEIQKRSKLADVPGYLESCIASYMLKNLKICSAGKNDYTQPHLVPSKSKSTLPLHTKTSDIGSFWQEQYCKPFASAPHPLMQKLPIPFHTSGQGSEVFGKGYERVSIEKSFFENNYKIGGMTPLKEMKKHKGWNKEYEKSVEVKLVNICKSCGSKAYKGCCFEYSSSNRVKIKMVIGWHT